VWKTASIEAGDPSTSHQHERKGQGEEEVWISDFNIWTDTVNDVGRIWKIE
jgi:hypothetical protein